MNKKTATTRLVEEMFDGQPYISEKEVAAAKEGMLDFLTSALAGAFQDENKRKVWKLFVEPSREKGSTLIGSNRLADPATAALWNGYLGHALDFDDAHKTVRGHPSTVILPTLLALAEEHRCAGSSLLKAYIIGVEVMARLAKAIGPGHYERGFHNTSTLGPIAAAAAGAILLNLSMEQTQKAIGFAATRSSGLRAQFGTDVKPLHAGLAAQAGLQAVQLAASDYNAARDVFAHENSFFTAFGSDRSKPECLWKAWGKDWEITNPGLIFKKYPCCSGLMQGIALLEDVQKEQKLLAEEIRKVTVTFPSGGDAALVHTRPENGLEGRFSIEYVIALFVIHGRLTFTDFLNGPISEELQAFFPLVKRDHDTSASTDHRFIEIGIHWKDGKTRTWRRDHPAPSASPKHKFVELFSNNHGLSHLPHSIHQMETNTDLLDVLKLLRVNT